MAGRSGGQARRRAASGGAPAGARARSGASRAAPLIMGIEGVLAIVFLFGGGTLVLLAISPIGRAIADRIRGKGQQAEVGAVRSELLEHKEALEQELEAVRRELAELAERVDFAERLLAKQREGQRIGPG